MKYLAILRDSFREAIDSKVIYALVAMSLLITLFMLTMSFTPLKADEAFSSMFNRGGLPLKKNNRGAQMEPPPPEHVEFDQNGNIIRRRPRHAEPVYQGVELLKGNPDSPSSEYRVTFYVDLGDRNFAAAARKSFSDRIPEMRRDLGKVEEYEIFKITDLRVADNDQNKFARDSTPEKRAEGVFLEMDTAPTAATHRIWPTEVGLFFGYMPLTFTRGRRWAWRCGFWPPSCCGSVRW